MLAPATGEGGEPGALGSAGLLPPGELAFSSEVGVMVGEVDELLGASFLGGIRSFIASSPLASANELIL